MMPGERQLLAGLRKEFAKFRRTHPRRTRVPERLRAGVLEALDSGARLVAVCQACGVTRTQLSRWRAPRRDNGGRPARGSEHAQVLTVVDRDAMAAGAEEISLDVGIGSWRLSIRMRPEGGPRR